MSDTTNAVRVVQIVKTTVMLGDVVRLKGNERIVGVTPIELPEATYLDVFIAVEIVKPAGGSDE